MSGKNTHTFGHVIKVGDPQGAGGRDGGLPSRTGEAAFAAARTVWPPCPTASPEICFT